MEIIEKEGKYLVTENDSVLYVAITYEEAEWYIKWKNREGAGNTAEDTTGCCK